MALVAMGIDEVQEEQEVQGDTLNSHISKVITDAHPHPEGWKPVEMDVSKDEVKGTFKFTKNTVIKILLIITVSLGGGGGIFKLIPLIGG